MSFKSRILIFKSPEVQLNNLKICQILSVMSLKGFSYFTVLRPKFESFDCFHSLEDWGLFAPQYLRGLEALEG